ncbi:DUF1707 domain-containing protein [Streptomyces sp. NPDC051940]|uniref:DUF1707 SHOCT-like domain-containing protein n=1 Tax=Streptomyces sp. NPDC051940 TaxID=3155675 RepID=UPI00344AFF91
MHDQRRISDQERDTAAALLAAGYADGRLDRTEHEQRLGRLYQVRTHGELRPLVGDLPTPGGALTASPPRRRMPGALRLLWTLYATGTAVSTVVYALVTVTTAHPGYPWPLWVAGPAGAALAALTLSTRPYWRARTVRTRRRNRR